MEKTEKYTLSREIEANEEIRSTQINRRLAVVVCTLFVLMITAVPVVQLISKGMPKEWTDDALRTSCYMENALTSHYQQLLTSILHSGNEKAIVGKEEGWLFYKPDVAHLTLPIDPQSEECIMHMKKQLDERGIRLVLLPTPLKPMICPHQLNHDFAEGKLLVHPEFHLWAERLKKAGVTVVNPMQSLFELNKTVPAFLRTDTHWSPEGMKTAASLLANTIGEEFSGVQSATYHAVDSTVCHRGDIYSMLRLAKEVNWIPAEQIKTETVLDAAGLFHSRQKQAEILLLGDSFTNIYSVANMGWGRAAGLAEHLSFLLQCPIDVISRNDGGSYATRQMLRDDMAKGNDRLAGKKVIIWQFAMRELSTGNWKTMDFDLGQASDSPQYLSIEEGTVLTTEATVADMATIPHPSTVTYEDHVVAVHLTDIEGQPGKEALVYMLAMEKRQLLPAANIRPGDRIALTMENWGSHEAVEGAFNRSELESDITFMAEPVWATLNNK